MALSLSGDDEEYDSESEQVRVLTFHYVTSLYACMFCPKCKLVFDRKPFVSGIVFFFFRLSFHPLFLSVSRRLEMRNMSFKPVFTVNYFTWTNSQLNVLYTELNRLWLLLRIDNRPSQHTVFSPPWTPSIMLATTDPLRTDHNRFI